MIILSCNTQLRMSLTFRNLQRLLVDHTKVKFKLLCRAFKDLHAWVPHSHVWESRCFRPTHP